MEALAQRHPTIPTVEHQPKGEALGRVYRPVPVKHSRLSKGATQLKRNGQKSAERSPSSQEGAFGLLQTQTAGKDPV